MGLEPLWSKEGNLVYFTDVMIIFVSHLTTGSGSEFCSSSCASPGLAHVQLDHHLFSIVGVPGFKQQHLVKGRE